MWFKRFWRGQVHKWMNRWRMLAAFSALVGTGAAVWVNQMILRGEEPRSAIVDAFKALNTAASAVCTLAIYSAHWLEILNVRLNEHLSRGTKLDVDVTFRSVGANVWFWVEFIICAVHVPPFMTSEVGGLNMENMVVYRIETMGCVWNMFRFYLLWWAFVHFMVHDLPMRHTVGSYSNVKFESLFALKRSLNTWYSFLYLSVGWAVLIVLLGYTYMSAEASSCLLPGSKNQLCLEESARIWTAADQSKFEKVNDLFLANSCWFIFVTMTTIGYGDVTPSTHVGRFVAVVAAQVGIILTALFTAALTNLMKYDQREQSAMVIIEREITKSNLMNKAQEIISLWWRRCKGKSVSRRQQRQDIYRLHTELQHYKQASGVRSLALFPIVQ
jgi:hypothetical protein